MLGELLAIPFDGMAWFHWVYLLSGSALVFLIHLRKNGSGRGFLGFLIPKELYTHRSTKLDFKYVLINRALRVILVAPFGVVTPAMGVLTYKIVVWLFGPPVAKTGDPLVMMLLISLGFTVVVDFILYLGHLAYHKIPWLWEFHKVHHSAEVLTPITVYRNHPVTEIVGVLSVGLGWGFMAGVGHYLLPSSPMGFTALGTPMLAFLFFFLGGNLRHSHVWLTYDKRLSHVVMSPAQHQIHHSKDPKHYDKNLALIFSFWDWLFGTLYVPEEDEGDKLEFGLKNDEELEFSSVWALYSRPFKVLLSSGLRWKRFALAAVTLLVAGGLGIGMFEVLVDRRMNVFPDFASDPVTGLTVNSAEVDRLARGRRVGGGFYNYRIVTDSDGCRVSPSKVRASPAGQNLVLLGDSFTFGAHAEHEKTLAGRLNSGLEGTNVYNFGVRGSCSIDYPELLRVYLRRKSVQPDLVVVGLFVAEEWGDVPRRKGRAEFGRYEVVDGYWLPPEMASMAKTVWGRWYCHLRVRGLRYSSLYATLFPPDSSSFAVPTKEPEPFHREDIMADLKEIEQISGLPRESIIIHFVPSAGEVARRIRETSKPTESTPNEEFWSELGSHLEEEGFRVSDPRERLVEWSKEKELFPFAMDGHLVPEGYEPLSAALLEELR